MTLWTPIAMRKINLNTQQGEKPPWRPSVSFELYQNAIDASAEDEAWLMTKREKLENKPSKRGYTHPEFVIETLCVRPKS